MVSATAYLNVALSDEGLNPVSVSQVEREVLLELLLTRRELLRSTISIESDVIDTLSELQANYEEHTKIIAEYKRFLDPLVLWLPSGSRLWKTDFNHIPEEMAVLLQAATGIEVAFHARFFGFMFLALILLLFHTRLREYQHRQNELISRPREASIRFTCWQWSPLLCVRCQQR